MLQNGENHNSRIVKITNQEFPKSSFSNGEDDKLGDVSIPDLEILTLYRPNKEDCSSKIQVVAGKQGAESQNQNSENHNSRIMKITNQDFSKSQIKNFDFQNLIILNLIILMVMKLSLSIQIPSILNLSIRRKRQMKWIRWNNTGQLFEKIFLMRAF